MAKRTCSVEGCGRAAKVRGYCQRCYYRLRSRGQLGKLPARPSSALPQTNGEDKLRKVWRAMHRRCESPKDDRYHRYGARGIRVCPQWGMYEAFRAWALEAGYADGLTIDRVNGDGDYEPVNCRWVTAKQQARNTSTNHLLTAFGETKPMAEWVDDPRCRVTYAALNQRVVRRGWDAERALTTPLILNNDKATHCPQGHPYDKANTSWTPEGWRTCRACKRDRARARH